MCIIVSVNATQLPAAMVCKLKKSLYGLKQAPRQWFAKLSSSILAFEYKQSKADYSLFTRQTKQGYITVLIYVNDTLLTGDSLSLINKLKAHLNHWFQMKDLWELRYFLGLEVARSSKGIFLSQKKVYLRSFERDRIKVQTPVSIYGSQWQVYQRRHSSKTN